MRRLLQTAFLTALVAANASGAAVAQHDTTKCKPVHADLVENGSTEGCKPSHPSCFLGEVDGNHGLRGTTYFRADSATAPIPTSPEFVGYSGVFEYVTDRGSLTARESGVTSQTQNVVTAHQRITDATGDFAGATGYFFVSGSNDGQRVVTKVTGVICYP